MLVGEENTTLSPSGDFDLYWSKTGGSGQYIVFMINSRMQHETGVPNFFPDYAFPSGEPFTLAWDQTNRAWLLQNRTLRRFTLNEKTWDLMEFAEESNDAEKDAFLEWHETVPAASPPTLR